MVIIRAAIVDAGVYFAAGSGYLSSTSYHDVVDAAFSAQNMTVGGRVSAVDAIESRRYPKPAATLINHPPICLIRLNVACSRGLVGRYSSIEVNREDNELASFRAFEEGRGGLKKLIPLLRSALARAMSRKERELGLPSSGNHS